MQILQLYTGTESKLPIKNTSYQAVVVVEEVVVYLCQKTAAVEGPYAVVAEVLDQAQTVAGQEEAAEQTHPSERHKTK